MEKTISDVSAIKTISKTANQTEVKQKKARIMERFRKNIQKTNTILEKTVKRSREVVTTDIEQRITDMEVKILNYKENDEVTDIVEKLRNEITTMKNNVQRYHE